jgi:hypothetical protein
MARKTFECPNCGADVPVGKKGCRECGSDASTGWMDSEEIDYQSVDIPDGYGPEDEVKQGVGRTQLVAGLLLLLIAGIVAVALLN